MPANGTAETRIPLTLGAAANTVPDKFSTALQVAVKTNVGILYFQTYLPAYILWHEDKAAVDAAPRVALDKSTPNSLESLEAISMASFAPATASSWQGPHLFSVTPANFTGDSTQASATAWIQKLAQWLSQHNLPIVDHPDTTSVMPLVHGGTHFSH